jgi:hypothetical protein
MFFGRLLIGFILSDWRGGVLSFPFKIDFCDDPGDQILLKIQSARNRFKSNGCVGLVVTNPTQLVWVQTDVG